jgi:hypothetical protein
MAMLAGKTSENVDWTRGSRVYRNLNNGCWSVQLHVTGKGWRVFKHEKALLGLNVTFVANGTGRQKVIAQKRKEVRAYAICKEVRASPSALDQQGRTSAIDYNPYKTGFFVNAGTGEKVVHADCVEFTEDGKVFAMLSGFTASIVAEQL